MVPRRLSRSWRRRGGAVLVRKWFWRVCAVAGVAAPWPAWPSDAVTPHVAYTIGHDDNLMRFAGPDQAQAVTGRRQTSDLYRRTEAGVALEQEFGRQKVSAGLTLYALRFGRFDELDHHGRDLSLRLRWQLGNQWEGTAGATHVKSSTPFIDFRSLDPNLRTQNRQFADAFWRFHPSWRAMVGLSRYAVRYDLPVQQGADRSERAFQAGMDFLLAAGNNVGVRVRRIDGDFPRRFAPGTLAAGNDFTQEELLGNADWQLTGKTALRLSGGRVLRRHGSARERDWSGFNGRVQADWKATGKTAVAVAAWRETGSYLDLGAGYTVNKGSSVSLAWSISEKLQMDALFKAESRDFPGAGVPGNAAGPDREDTLRHVEAVLSYRPTRHAEIRAGLFRDTRKSNLEGLGYRANGAFISARYAF